MNSISNNFGTKFSVGAKVRVTKTFSTLNTTTTIQKVSSKFIYIDGRKYNVNSRTSGHLTNCYSFELI